jgi:multiple sugar transport system permease protein
MINMGYKTRKRLSNGVCDLIVLLALVFFIFPIFWIFFTSIKTRAQAFAFPPLWFFKPTLHNYVAVFTERHLLKNLINSVIISSGATFFALLIGALAAYAIARFSFRGRDSIAFDILSVRMFPPIASAIPYFIVMRNIHLYDTHLGLIIAYTTFNLPFVIWMMRGFIEEVPVDLEEAGMVDGCSRLGAVRRIVVPLISPGMAATAIFCVILSWNEFLFAMVLSNKKAVTLPVAVAALISDRGIPWGEITAAAVIIIVPILIFAMSVQKYLIAGLTGGAVKG